MIEFGPLVLEKKILKNVQCNFTVSLLSPLGEGPVRIRVRIGPPHPLVCRKRRLNEAVLRMRPEKPRPRVTAGVAR